MTAHNLFGLHISPSLFHRVLASYSLYVAFLLDLSSIYDLHCPWIQY